MELPKEAKLKYGDNDLRMITPGTFVRCAVTGDVIELNDLMYWSVERQEPYRDAEAANQALHNRS